MLKFAKPPERYSATYTDENGRQQTVDVEWDKDSNRWRGTLMHPSGQIREFQCARHPLAAAEEVMIDWRNDFRREADAGRSNKPGESYSGPGMSRTVVRSEQTIPISPLKPR